MTTLSDIKMEQVARNIAKAAQHQDDIFWVLALVPPLAVRLYGDSAGAAMQRLLLLALALSIAYAWSALFTRSIARSAGWGQSVFAIVFVVMLPGPVAWGSALLALSFGAVFGREIFGGRPILPPALIGLAFAIFSFPSGGFEAVGTNSQSADVLLAVACLPGAAVLVHRGSLVWQIAAGAVAGALVAGLLMGAPAWWQHPLLGTFVVGVLFLAAAPESAAKGIGARWLHGILVGALIVVIRIADLNQPDAVVFAALLGGLFAPLIERTLRWRHQDGE